MEIHNLQDIESALSKTRNEFHRATVPIRSLLDRPVSLFFDAIGLIGNVAKDTDDERYALEVLTTAFRRVIASVVLLESGLPQEAHMVLRNALEWMLIAIDIAYNSDSLGEWKRTVSVDLKDIDHREWYFSRHNICERIRRNEGSVYPELERELALGTKGPSGRGICEEWKLISAMSVHAHSQAQLWQLFDSSGKFQLLGRKTVDKYEKDFKQYQVFVLNIITLLIGIPKYRDLIGTSEVLRERATSFAKNYSGVISEMNSTLRIME